MVSLAHLAKLSRRVRAVGSSNPPRAERRGGQSLDRILAWDNRGCIFFGFAFCFHNVGGTREDIAQLSGGNPRFPETGIKVRNARFVCSVGFVC